MSATPRIDLELITSLVPKGAKVLDIGCGEGDLLAMLRARREVEGRGLEISQSGVNACVARGLAAVQGDADSDLADYPDLAFDYAILSQTIQAVHHPAKVLDHMLRIARRAIVSLPNFGYWRLRAGFLFSGRMPVSPTLPYSWHNTPNIHLCTIADFLALAAGQAIVLERFLALNRAGAPISWLPAGAANFFAAQAIFQLTRLEEAKTPFRAGAKPGGI